MRAEGYEIKEGKKLSFHAPGWDRFTRSDKLGADYTREALRERSSNRGGHLWNGLTAQGIKSFLCRLMLGNLSPMLRQKFLLMSGLLISGIDLSGKNEGRRLRN